MTQQKRRAHIDRFARDAHIISLSRQGLDNVTIAKRVGISRNRVRDIVHAAGAGPGKPQTHMPRPWNPVGFAPAPIDLGERELPILAEEWA